MASSKHWALYAKKLRPGTWNEHLLAGARVGQVGIRLSWDVLHGWRAETHFGRLGFTVSMWPSSKDPRVRESLIRLFPKQGEDAA